MHIGTSTDVERVFSHGRKLIADDRGRLSAESVRALMCIGAWKRAGLLHRKDLMDVVEQEEEMQGDFEYLTEDPRNSLS